MIVCVFLSDFPIKMARLFVVCVDLVSHLTPFSSSDPSNLLLRRLLLLLLLLLQLPLQPSVGFGLLYDFGPQSSIFTSLQFFTFIFFKPSSTCSSHLSLGLPTGLDEHGSHSFSLLTVLIVSILITCAAQRSLCDFLNLTIVSFLIRISNYSFVFILRVPSLSCVGPTFF